jgi:hypothetical protein
MDYLDCVNAKVASVAARTKCLHLFLKSNTILKTRSVLKLETIQLQLKLYHRPYLSDFFTE